MECWNIGLPERNLIL